MEELSERLHRTWIKLLKDGNREHDANFVKDAVVIMEYNDFNFAGIVVELPTSVAVEIMPNDEILDGLRKSLFLVCHGHIRDQNDQQVELKIEDIKFRVKLE